MSEFTLSQPSTPTSGLQPYDLRGGARARRLAQTTKPRRLALVRRRRGPVMQKGHDMSTFQDMIETLKTSVIEIAASPAEGHAELLNKTFGEFEEAIAPELEKAVGAGTEEVLNKIAEESPELAIAPLYKGLGTVGRVARLCAMMAENIERIDEGGSSDDDAGDPASDEVVDLLEHALAAVELALRAAVNDHVEPVGEDDDLEHPEDGMHLVTVPSAEAPDDEDASIVLKTALPEDLAKFATDPASIGLAAVELGTSLLLKTGVEEHKLAKLFEGDGELQKMDPASAGQGGDTEGAQPDDGSADMQGQGADPNDLGGQLEIATRIAAMQLMQLDHIMQLLDLAPSDAMGAAGAADPNAADAGSDPAADAGADPNAVAAAAPSDDEEAKKKFGKSAETEELQKRIDELEKSAAEPSPEVAALRKQLADVQGNLEKLSRQPAPAKAALAGAGLSKASDSGAENPQEELLKDLSSALDRARTDQDRNLVLAKMAFKFPGLDLSSLRETLAKRV